MSRSKTKILMEKPLCFAVGRRLLDSDNRLDTWFFHPQFTAMLERLETPVFEVCEIGNPKVSLRVVDGIHKTPDYVDSGLIFIQVNNVREGEVDFERNIKHVSKDWEKEVLNRYSPRPGDVLITKDGTIGIAAIVPESHPDFSIFVSVAAIRPNLECIIPRYLETVLNSRLGREQVMRYTRGAVLSHLLLEEIRKIRVPILPRVLQERIAEIMEGAYEKKKDKLAKANHLLNSIDNLVLESLGMRVPESESNLFYVVKLESDLQARIDPAFYSPKNANLMNSIENSPHDIKNFEDISESIVSGQRPKGGVKYINEGTPSIGGEHITLEGDFNFERVKYIPREFHENQKRGWIKPLDIVVVKDGATTGKAAIVSEDFPFGECNINEHVFKITIRDGYNPYYVFSYLVSSLGQDQIKRLISGAAQKGLTGDAIKNLKIVVPSSETQNRIADDVRTRKEESRNLKTEAEEAVERAKEDVERIITGRS